MKHLIHFIICSSILFIQCKDGSLTHPNPSVKWEVQSINDNKSRVAFTLTDFPKDTSWILYYNHMLGLIDSESLPPEIAMERIAGDFFKLYPTADIEQSENQIVIPYDLNVVIQRKSDAPAGVYMTIDNGSPIIIDDFEVSGINSEVLSLSDIPTAQSRYDDNASLQKLDAKDLLKIIPAPKSIAIQNGSLNMSRSISINAPEDLHKEIDVINSFTKKELGITFTTQTENADVDLSLGNVGPAESYSLTISSDGIDIKAKDNAGAFYALHSLVALVEPSSYQKQNDIELPYCTIKDEPRFEYRGVHLDVARNFHSKETVLKVLNRMSRYKLNKFHFHITDDEGWRLEIPGLPELTEVGSKRGHTTNELDNLIPHYGSGPMVNGSAGTGYYTRKDFIEILQYAHERHIEVIPEIDIPSHARAAIKSMASRYQRYMDKGDEAAAKEYLLHDFDDQSEYSSAQNFSDNIVCVCQESTYNFVAKVIDEVVKIFEEAEVPLLTIHSGGDEVPYGPWQKSPICKKFIEENPEVNHTDDLHAYFMKRFKVIMDEKDLNTAGWEEIVLKHSEEAHEGTVLNEDMIGESYIPYVWNAVWGWGREDMAYKLANAGYEIVFCNSAMLYMDMAYDKDPEETGLSWSGWTTTQTAYDVIPYDIFANAKYDKNGNKLKQEDIDSKVRLTEKGKENFKGIQGQIWCETITTAEKLEYMMFPKVLAIAERAWSPQTTWSAGNDELQLEDWNVFSNSLGQRELPKLDVVSGGINYRIPPPGAKIINGQLYANTSFPGLEIRYTLDGSEPTVNSSLYEGPIETSSKNIALKAFNTTGRSSRMSSISPKRALYLD